MIAEKLNFQKPKNRKTEFCKTIFHSGDEQEKRVLKNYEFIYPALEQKILFSKNIKIIQNNC